MQGWDEPCILREATRRPHLLQPSWLFAHRLGQPVLLPLHHQNRPASTSAISLQPGKE